MQNQCMFISQKNALFAAINSLASTVQLQPLLNVGGIQFFVGSDDSGRVVDGYKAWDRSELFKALPESGNGDFRLSINIMPLLLHSDLLMIPHLY